MAIHYVDSAAAGANDGTSWTDAWTTLAAAVGAAAGDFVYVDDGHSETTAGGASFTNGTQLNPVKIICVDKADDSVSTGASVLGSSNGLYGNVYVYGLTFGQPAGSGTTCNYLGGNQIRQVWVNCDHKWSNNQGDGTSNNANLVFIGGTVDYRNAAADAFKIAGRSSLYEFYDVTFSNTGSISVEMFEARAQGARLVLNGCDLTNAPVDVFDISNTAVDYQEYKILNCKVGASFNPYNGTLSLNQSVLVENCTDGTVTVPGLLYGYYGYGGEASASLSKYRTNGADDGVQANAYSWEVITTSATLEQYGYFQLPSIFKWVASGSQTVTLHLAGGASLSDDDLWVEVFSPNEAGSATTQSQYNSTRTAPLATPAALTTDSGSTWNGTGVGTKQKIDVSISPTIAGVVELRVYVAKPSATVYVDPKISSTGNQRMFAGLQIDGDESGGGGGGFRRISLNGGFNG